MPSKHAILAASAASRWIPCTPSARFGQQLPNEETVFAAEGTFAHELGALVLSVRCGVFTGGTKQFNDYMENWQAQIVEFYTNEYPQPDPYAAYLSMLEYAEEWAAYVQDIMQDVFDGELYIEREYDLSQFVPLGFGTSDATVKLPKVLHVADLKFGAGQPVTAVENSQLKLYALGALRAMIEEDPNYRPDYIVLHIFQPRAGGASTWQITVADLLQWGEYVVAPAAAQAIIGQGEFVSGNHCHFCPAKTVCRAYYLEFAEVLRISDKRAMTPRERAKVLDRGKSLAAWIKKVEEQAVADLLVGKDVDGFKLVAGKGRRQFKNENDVVDILLGTELADDIFEAKMRSLTDIETSLGKKRFAQLFQDAVVTQSGAPQLAGEEDSRPAISAHAHDDYLDDDPDYEDLT